MFEQMTTFVRIAEMGTITRAARSLGVSLPMASRHLRWLEKELGIALVHRTTRQLHLTDASQAFATRARALLVGLDDAKQALLRERLPHAHLDVLEAGHCVWEERATEFEAIL